MTDHPILFSGAMVRALLAGRKTQTRRVLKPQPECDHSMYPSAPLTSMVVDADGAHCAVCGGGLQLATTESGVKGIPVRYAVGDRLWVRERIVKAVKIGAFVWYDADWRGTDHPWPSDWTRDFAPPMHMPRWASRLTLTVTEVRVQRLQEIIEDDAIAEGLELQQGGGLGPGPGFKWIGIGYHAGTVSSWGKCYHTPHSAGRPGCSCNVAGPSPAQCAYRELWNRLNEARGFGWDVNPWVVAVSFTVEHRNIDQRGDLA
jgi:hypothetical protein